MSLRPVMAALAGLLLTAGIARGASDGINPSILAPGLVQAGEAISRLDRLVEEASAIGTALFRVHNEFGQNRAMAPAPPDCTTPWLLDLGARTRELGRGFRDAVQSARVQGRRVEAMTVEPTVRPLLDPETNHRILSLLTRVDDLVRRYPEAASWQEAYVEPMLRGCEPALVPAAGMADAAPVAAKEGFVASERNARKSALVAVIAFGEGWLCPGAVPAAGVMLVAGEVCYSASESCDCTPAPVSPATVLGPATNAGSAN